MNERDPGTVHRAPAGSLRDFAVMYAPAHARPVLHALYAYEAEIAATVEATNHEVAHARLQWWRGEVDRLLGGRPQHPITLALLPLHALVRDRLALLHEPLVAADIDLARMTFANSGELEAYCFRAGGAVQTLAAHASSEDSALDSAEQAFARRLGSAVRRTEQLRDLRRHLAAGRLPLPLAVLEAAGVDPHSVRPDAMTPRLAAVLAATRDALRRELSENAQALPRQYRARQRSGLVLAALHGQLLKRVEHGQEIARVRAEVPAWARLWTAWRTAVRT